LSMSEVPLVSLSESAWSASFMSALAARGATSNTRRRRRRGEERPRLIVMII
jgi:hypothetical protein